MPLLPSQVVSRVSDGARLVRDNPDVAKLVAWPDPPAGFKLRSYHLPAYAQADSSLRVFRSTKLMVNPLMPRPVPRDVHPEMGSPSLLVAPPKVVHTSRNIGPDLGRLVDIFAPPRLDFSRRGIVCNADEYPMPAELGDRTGAKE